ncbi:MAG: PilZ domain-containing protein [Gemmatales bacterium]|nr:PilZ domain-containing protein [Gemmatales bacterium]MDW7994306.1 PilZ domain-containing protein [Gemmatales bacterium]
MAEIPPGPDSRAPAQGSRERRGHLRKAPRGRCVVHLFRGTFGLGRNVALELLDVSLSGIKLRLSEPLRVGEEVTLQLLGQGHLRPVKTVARVIWCRPEHATYVAGLAFEKLLTYADFLHIT